ncbi:MAG TPA: substrate-binding domain-containing protein, partial [Roseiflexaceae bacterium]|nr:substrate-binding domain-containing protein [Roseiflexaceae bacterium]
MRQIARFVAIGYFAVVGIAAVLQLIGLTQFTAPFNLIPARARPPLVVNLVYSSEQREWLTAAAQQFAAGQPTVRGRPIQINLQSRGSQAIIAELDQLKPVGIIPASSAQITRLAQSGSARLAGGPNAPQPIALSPLVLVGWKERVDLLFPQGQTNAWSRLHDAILKTNWSDPSLGGKSEWGPVKWGHTSPRTSNSGAETLVLLAYAFSNKAQGLSSGDINNPAFQAWLQEIESGVGDFPDSSDTLFSAFLARGPSAYDVVTAYENQAVLGVERAKKWGELEVLYPSATVLSDHPFAILDAAWVTPEQQDAARAFRDYLLSEPAQRLALRYGFRPANAAVSLT